MFYISLRWLGLIFEKQFSWLGIVPLIGFVFFADKYGFSVPQISFLITTSIFLGAIAAYGFIAFGHRIRSVYGDLLGLLILVVAILVFISFSFWEALLLSIIIIPMVSIFTYIPLTFPVKQKGKDDVVFNSVAIFLGYAAFVNVVAHYIIYIH